MRKHIGGGRRRTTPLFIVIFIVAIIISIIAVQLLPVPKDYKQLCFFLMALVLSAAGVAVASIIQRKKR